MFKYLYNYVTLLLIFLVIDLSLLLVPSFGNLLGYIPTITMVGSVSRFLLVPYAYLIVKLLFINKANNSKNVTDFLNIKKKLTVEVTFINIIATLIEMIFLQHTVIWLLYTAFVLLFLKVLKTKKENIDDITDKNIKNYFNKKIK